MGRMPDSAERKEEGSMAQDRASSAPNAKGTEPDTEDVGKMREQIITRRRLSPRRGKTNCTSTVYCKT